MKTQDAYNSWAKTYDDVVNRTRDLEAVVLRTVLKDRSWDSILELGCGTGKNTEWLSQQGKQLTAVDFSEEMMELARQKNKAGHVKFQQADITKPWSFPPSTLITCSLILEHIEDLDFIFSQAAKTLLPGGIFYICELHPYKQLQGSRAKFEQGQETMHLEYFIHHVSDYFGAAQKHGLNCSYLREWFDEDDREQIPRLVSYLFEKK